MAGVAEAGGVSPKIIEQIIPRDLRQEIDAPKTHVVNIDGKEFSFNTTADASMEEIQAQAAREFPQAQGARLNPMVTSPAEQRVTTLGAIDATTRGASDALTLGADNKIVRRSVKVGTVSDKGLPILSGLVGSERIIVSAGAFLTPGEEIQPVLETKRR